MATVKFLIQSIQDSTPIYVRFSIGRDGIYKRKTRETINPKYWKLEEKKTDKSKAPKPKEKVRNLVGSNGEIKNIEKLAVSATERTNLRETLDRLKALDQYIIRQYNKRTDTEIINAKWLEEVIEAYYNGGRRPELLNNLANFLQHFESKILPYKTNQSNGKNKGQPLSERTKAKYRDIIAHLLNFMKLENLNLKVSDYNKTISDRFQDYLLRVAKHSEVSVGREITYPKAILKEAIRLNLEVDQTVFIDVKGSKPKTPTPILIIDKEQGIDELQQIKDLKLVSDRLILAREWMIIGIHTGQRAQDMFALHKNQIKTVNGRKYISIAQDKTGNLIEIPIHKDILEILEKYDGNFPPIFSDNFESAKTIFNKQIYKLCKLANLDRLDYGKQWDEKEGRYVYGQYPIYSLFNIHSLRRTFCSMYYGVLPTAVIKAVSGHSEEQLLLIYINKSGSMLSHKFYEHWEREEQKEVQQPAAQQLTAN